MSSPNLIDERHIVNASVRIGGQKVDFVHLTIEQEYGQHNHFEIVLDYDSTGSSFMDDPTEQIELIGRLAVITFRHGNDTNESYTFKGVITEIQKTGKEGKHGYLTVKGCSPTIMLDRGRRMDVYSDTTLYHIFNKLIDGVYSDYMAHVNEPTFDSRIDFVMQYNETDWQFLQRLAYLYGENLFYSGKEILFGTYEEWEAEKMTYDKEITHMQFCSRMLPNDSITYQYVAEQDTIFEKQSPDKIENSNTYLDKTAQQSKPLTVNKPAKNLVSVPVTSPSEMDELAKKNKVRTAAETVCIKGVAKTYRSTIGRLITIGLPEGMSSKKELGTYRVIKSVHRIDQNHRYSNEFEAVPASLQTMPVAEPRMPVAESILGKVTSNEDPRGQGRVQVDFSFANQYSRVWMRVMSPNAGSSSEVGQNRGMVFVPEKGDQVMVGFEYGDPNRPYVMGSMFHGKNGQGGGGNNAIKSIITRSGIKIVFNDDAKSIHIADPSGNTWNMDGNGNINVNAPKKITIESTDFEINARNNLSINIGNNLLTDVGNTNSMFAKTFKNNVSKDMHIYSNTALISSTLNMQLQSDEMLVFGEQKMTLHSDKSFLANSMGIMDLRSSDAMTLAQEAETHTAAPTEEIAVAVVQFRQKAADAKLYGFDWMRVRGEPGNDYETIIESGVESVTTDPSGQAVVVEYADKAKTYTALKNKYNVIQIKRDTPARGTQESEYFVPRMTLFPPGVDTSYAHPSSQPKTSVELELWVEILKEVDKLELDYDKNTFDITEINLTNKTPGAKAKLSSTITLTCKRAFSSKEQIKVWAYPKPVANSTQTSANNTTNTPTASKFLAGKLIVYPNAANKRKKIRVALVSVITDWMNTGIKQRGRFSSNSLNFIQMYLNQSLVECSIIEKPLSQTEIANSDLFENNFVLNFANNNDFKRTYQYVDISTSPVKTHTMIGRFSYMPKGLHPLERAGLYMTDVVDSTGNFQGTPHLHLYTYLKQEFKQKYPNYSDCFLIFSFGAGINPNCKELAGQGEGLNTTSSIVLDGIPDEGVGHEMFHVMGLGHAFRNKTGVLITSDQEFIFEMTKTDNIMDYCLPASMNSSWSWQWEKLNTNIK